MKEAAGLGAAAAMAAVGTVVAVGGSIVRSQAGIAIAEGTGLIDEFRRIRLPSSGLIEDGIAMINNGRAAAAAGMWGIRVGATIAAFGGGYAIGAAGMCAIDPGYYN